MADNFDLQGWMREQKQGPYAGAKGAEKISFTSPKPKSKTGLNESLMGMIDLKPIGSLSEEYDKTYEEDGMEEGTSEEAMYDVYLVIDGKKQKYGGGPYKKKDLSAINTSIWSRYGEDLDAVQFEKLGSETMEEGMGDDDDMDDAPEIEDTWNKPSEFDKDDDEEKMAAMAMKQAKSSKKGMKGVTADWTIDDILGGDDDDF